jgi:outer membrane protein TolC
MKSSNINWPVIGMLVTLLVTAGLFEALGEESPVSLPATNASIVELLHKRHAVLSQLAKVQTEAYRHGNASIEAVIKAHQELLGVELELAKTDDERINLFEKAIQMARDLEQIAATKYKSGNASQADVLMAEADGLKAQTELLRERQKSTTN